MQENQNQIINPSTTQQALEPSSKASGDDYTTLECLKHGRQTVKQFYIGSKQVVGKCPECERMDSAAMRQEEDVRKLREERAKRNELHAKLFRKSGIAPRFKTKNFEGFDCEDQNLEKLKALNICIHYADNFEENKSKGASLIMCGNPGTGKTHLAASIGNQIMEQGKSVKYITMPQAMRAVKETYSRNSEMSEQQVINSFRDYDLLILDEVGVQHGTETEKFIAFEIINGRYDYIKPTIYISNLDISGLKEYLGDRVMDRIREGGGKLLPFMWSSYRK